MPDGIGLFNYRRITDLAASGIPRKPIKWGEGSMASRY